MDPRRSERVAESLRAELEELINYELEDPRVTSVSITETLLSPDGRRARIRVAIAGTETEQAECLKALDSARGFLKAQIGERLTLFRLPDLSFETDLSPSLRSRAPHLLKRIRKGRAKEQEP